MQRKTIKIFMAETKNDNLNFGLDPKLKILLPPTMPKEQRKDTKLLSECEPKSSFKCEVKLLENFTLKPNLQGIKITKCADCKTEAIKPYYGFPVNIARGLNKQL